ncbi:MAG: hypothetical protein MUO64_03455 [Anaerolineales bacterium]|nr:hypothetical protein [Anaerolineales bacterium]
MRKIRTPGSVRGLLGNWQSYRNGGQISMTKVRQITVFDVPESREGTFSIFHDESGIDAAHDRFQLHGALIVPQQKFQNTLEELIKVRHDYQGRVHFVSLRDNTENPKAKIASDWLKLFIGELSNYCFYKCLIVDRNSPAFDETRFTKAYHLYNFTALLAIFSGIVWSLKQYDGISLSIFSEEASRAEEDNFVTYLPRELINKAEKKKSGFPKITVPDMKVILVNGDPRKVQPELAGQCELIQLTDVITSAVSQAINAKATQQVKIDLGKMVADWIKDTRLPPWLQAKKLHRRFSVSCFPDVNGNFYDVHLSISAKDQLKFDF